MRRRKEYSVLWDSTNLISQPFPRALRDLVMLAAEVRINTAAPELLSGQTQESGGAVLCWAGLCWLGIFSTVDLPGVGHSTGFISRTVYMYVLIRMHTCSVHIRIRTHTQCYSHFPSPRHIFPAIRKHCTHFCVYWVSWFIWVCHLQANIASRGSLLWGN